MLKRIQTEAVMYFLFLEWLEKPAMPAGGLFQHIEDGIITFNQYVGICIAVGLCTVSYPKPGNISCLLHRLLQYR